MVDHFPEIKIIEVDLPLDTENPNYDVILEKFFKDNGLDIKIILGWGPNSDPNKNLLVSVTTPKAGTALDPSTKELIMMVYEGYNPPPAET
jgi:hypothetical protein